MTIKELITLYTWPAKHTQHELRGIYFPPPSVSVSLCLSLRLSLSVCLSQCLSVCLSLSHDDRLTFNHHSNYSSRKHNLLCSTCFIQHVSTFIFTSIYSDQICTMWDAVWLTLVALLWGSTNPLMKKGGQGIERIERDTKITQFLAELKFLVLNWKVMQKSFLGK